MYGEHHAIFIEGLIRYLATICSLIYKANPWSSHIRNVFSVLKVWNYVGIVRCHSEEEPSSIDIEFHDTSLHHAMQEVNQMNHTMAALSDVAVLLACQAQEELPR